MNRPFFNSKNGPLIVSVLTNILLIFVCFWLFSTASSFYTDYRYFRALGIGTSESSILKISEPVAGEKRVVLYGDSRIELWNPLPHQDKTVFINAGISGETTTEIRRRFNHDVLRHNPDVVVMQAGVNDLTASITRGIIHPGKLIDDMYSNMRYFITSLRERDIQVVVTSIFPNDKLNLARKMFWSNSLTNDIRESNMVLKSLTEDAGAYWLNLDPVFYDGNGSLDSKLYIDTLHINAKGYAEINTLLENVLLQISEP